MADETPGRVTATLEGETTATPLCPECGGKGCIEAPGCNCGVGPSGYYGMHEQYCGLEPCPRGCPFIAVAITSALTGTQPSEDENRA